MHRALLVKKATKPPARRLDESLYRYDHFVCRMKKIGVKIRLPPSAENRHLDAQPNLSFRGGRRCV